MWNSITPIKSQHEPLFLQSISSTELSLVHQLFWQSLYWILPCCLHLLSGTCSGLGTGHRESRTGHEKQLPTWFLPSKICHSHWDVPSGNSEGPFEAGDGVIPRNDQGGGRSHELKRAGKVGNNGCSWRLWGGGSVRNALGGRLNHQPVYCWLNLKATGRHSLWWLSCPVKGHHGPRSFSSSPF